MMTLRPANMDDADFLLELKNDPVMRKFAVVTHKKIAKKDHVKWLKTHLHEISIVVVDYEAIGMLRVSGGEVSINIRPDFRGLGYGTQALEFCPENVWAKIVNGNVASMRLFLKSGFEITGYEKNYYVLEN